VDGSHHVGLNELGGLEGRLPARALVELRRAVGSGTLERGEFLAALHEAGVPLNLASVKAAATAPWSAARKTWCCAHWRTGCGAATTAVPSPKVRATTTSLRYDCVAGYASRALVWTPHKALWCCQLYKRGCSILETTAGPGSWTASGASPTQREMIASTDGATFNCEVGAAQWQHEWSEAKKAYCCQHAHRGCTASTTPCPADYDCDAGYDEWERGWTVVKKAWCCYHKHIGCPSTTSSPLI